MKTQQIRLLDVFVIGPLMIYSGYLNRKQNPLISYATMFAGGATIAFNWQNYREIEKQKTSE